MLVMGGVEAVLLACSLINSTFSSKKWIKSGGLREGGGAGGAVLVRLAIVSNRNFGLFLLFAINVE